MKKQTLLFDNERIELGENILLNDELKQTVQKIAPYASKVLLVIDQNVKEKNPLFVQNIFNLWDLEKIQLFEYLFVAKEENKNIGEYEKIQKELISKQFSREDLIVSIGGGITSDIVGFVASTFKRGIKDIYIPTTTLAMIDASIGGKTGINYGNAKNMIGSFYEPSLIIMDTIALNSLPKREYNAGLVEALKMGLTLDKDLYECFLEEHLDILNIIEKSIKAKMSVVKKDLYDNGLRDILNFGHTIAHAIELKSNFNHGECVAIGIINRIQNNELKTKVIQILKKIDIDVLQMEKQIESFSYHFENDKKVINNKISEIYLIDIEKIKREEIKL